MKRLLGLVAGGALLGNLGKAFGAQPRASASYAAMDGDPFIGEIAIFGFNFAPVGWAMCNGQLLAISQNTALFSLLGTTYGGNGQTTFALPNLQSRVPLHFGQGSGLSQYALGETTGNESVTLVTNQLPSHTHQLIGDTNPGTSDTPGNGLLARNPAGVPNYGLGTGATMSASAIGNTGGGQPHNNIQPILALNFCIALEGIFPSR